MKLSKFVLTAAMILGSFAPKTAHADLPSVLNIDYLSSVYLFNALGDLGYPDRPDMDARWLDGKNLALHCRLFDKRSMNPIAGCFIAYSKSGFAISAATNGVRKSKQVVLEQDDSTAVVNFFRNSGINDVNGVVSVGDSLEDKLNIRCTSVPASCVVTIYSRSLNNDAQL